MRMIRNSFMENPVAWILAGLLALAECGNYQNGSDLRRVCDLLGNHVISGPHHPVTAKQEIDKICLDHEPPESD